MALIDTDTRAVLDMFQSAYAAQFGQKMIIGSEEYALSALFSQVFSQLAEMQNASYKNRFLSTANGVFLDNIAAAYNLSRTQAKTGKPWFVGSFVFNDDGRQYAAGAYSLTIAGHEYTNKNEFTDQKTQLGGAQITFEAVEDHSEPLTRSELAAALGKSAILLDMPLWNAGAELSDDNEFRNYVQTNKRLFATGTAESYEAAARLSSPFLADVHVVRQNEEQFEPGKVKIYYSLNSRGISFIPLFTFDASPVISEAVDFLNVRHVGAQSVEPILAQMKIVAIDAGDVRVSSQYSKEVARDLFTKKAEFVRRHVCNVQKIFAPLVPRDAFELLKKPLLDFCIADEVCRTADDFEKFEQVKNFVVEWTSGKGGEIIEPGRDFDCVYLFDIRGEVI